MFGIVDLLALFPVSSAFKCLDGDDFDCPPAETTDNVTVIIPSEDNSRQVSERN